MQLSAKNQAELVELKLRMRDKPLSKTFVEELRKVGFLVPADLTVCQNDEKRKKGKKKGGSHGKK